jgi:hypothetical protein
MVDVVVISGGGIKITKRPQMPTFAEESVSGRMVRYTAPGSFDIDLGNNVVTSITVPMPPYFVSIPELPPLPLLPFPPDRVSACVDAVPYLETPAPHMHFALHSLAVPPSSPHLAFHLLAALEVLRERIPDAKPVGYTLVGDAAPQPSPAKVLLYQIPDTHKIMLVPGPFPLLHWIPATRTTGTPSTPAHFSPEIVSMARKVLSRKLLHPASSLDDKMFDQSAIKHVVRVPSVLVMQ